jgi:predicted component of type VI protein secretion system
VSKWDPYSGRKAPCNWDISSALDLIVAVFSLCNYFKILVQQTVCDWTEKREVEVRVVEREKATQEREGKRDEQCTGWFRTSLASNRHS